MIEREHAAAPGEAPVSDERLDVAVVGAGQAGLAIGHELARRGLRFAILEAESTVG